MSTESSHIVHKLFVEIETNSTEKGYALKDNAAGFISGSLSPALEELFEELEKKLNGSVLTLDKLSVDISAKTSDLTHGDIERLICTSIQKEINQTLLQEPDEEVATKPESKLLLPASKRQLQAIFHFLKTGSKPWWIPNNAGLNVLMETSYLLELARTDTQTLVQELQSGNTENFVKRMLFQLPEQVLIEWFTRAFHFPAEPSIHLPKNIPFQTLTTKEKWWIRVLEIFLEYRQRGTISEAGMEQLIVLSAPKEVNGFKAVIPFIKSITGQKISPDREKKLNAVLENDKLRKAPEAEKKVERPEKANHEQIAHSYEPVENAGLILLHPFLKPFLTEIGLLKNKQLTDPELVAHVLHFLATGNENAREYELQFEKFLCGIPADEPIQQERFIPEEIKEEAGKLIAAVLEHWTALKSDSPDLLRFEFLQREAKIIIEEYQSTRLVFERKAQDILLDKLPWNLGIVKIDWQEDLLFIEW